ncbi:MAG: sulfurtransferase TusA family protein [Candidatus Bathyarchaeia archaeon]
MSVKAYRQLGCLGMFCQLHVVKTKIELERMLVGSTLEIVVGYPVAEQDLQSPSGSTGQEVQTIDKRDKENHILIKKTR